MSDANAAPDAAGGYRLSREDRASLAEALPTSTIPNAIATETARPSNRHLVRTVRGFFSGAIRGIWFRILVDSLDYQLLCPSAGLRATPGRPDEPAHGGYLGPTRLISYDFVEGPGSSRNVPVTKGANHPAFSGDSRWIAFASGTGAIYRHRSHADINTDVVVQNGTAVTNRVRPPNVRVCTECGAPSLNDEGNLVAYESRAGGVNECPLQESEHRCR